MYSNKHLSWIEMSWSSWKSMEIASKKRSSKKPWVLLVPPVRIILWLCQWCHLAANALLNLVLHSYTKQVAWPTSQFYVLFYFLLSIIPDNSEAMVSSYRYDIESKIKFATAYAAIARSCHFVRQGGNFESNFIAYHLKAICLQFVVIFIWQYVV